MPNAPSGVPSVNRGSAVLGLAANARFAGLAITIDGQPVHCRVARLRRGRDGPPMRVSTLVASALRQFRPVALVVLVDDVIDKRRTRSREARREILAPALASASLPTIEVTRSDLARTLGLSRCTNVALRRELSRRLPIAAVAGTARSADARESERYWECAVLASGATTVPFLLPPTVHA